jgi:hypothetical protein
MNRTCGFNCAWIGLLVLGASLLNGSAQSIQLNSGAIDTSGEGGTVSPVRAATTEFSGKQLHLVQFDGPIQPGWVAQLIQDGYQIVDFVPDNAYLVFGGASALKLTRAHATHVQWEGAYLASDKINPRARIQVAKAGQLYAVQLVLDEASNAATLALIESLKLAPLRSSAVNSQLHFLNVVVALPAARLAELAAQPDVVSINTYELPHMLCERQGQIVAGNLNVAGSQPSGVGYYAWLLSKGFTQSQFDSSGFIVDIADDGWDNGVAATPANREFRKGGDAAQASRMKYSRTASTLSATASHGADGHGNINISIVGGFSTNSGSPFVDTAGYHRGQGINPFANLGNTKVFADGGTWDPTDAQEAAFIASNYSSGVRISSDSWGNTGDGSYDVSSQNYDSWTRDSQPAVAGNQQVLYVFAAGNDGSGTTTIGPPGSGKNIISVGAAENYNQFGTDGCSVTDAGADNANDIIDFSSRGPCTDGRKKPDIVAPGTHVQGAASFYSGYNGSGVCDQYQPAGQTNYAASSGTSHSTPAVAGGSTLVYQYFINQGWGTPSPAMVKAYLMNAARYMSGVDTGDTLPSNNQGMGCMNLGMAFDGAARILRDQLTNDLFTATGQSRTFYGTVSDTNKPLRITLGWTDAPGSTTGNAYKNNLDLAVTIGGTTYKGNVFSGAYSSSGGSADVKNNVECVFRPAGANGLVSITVTAYNINSDGVPNYGGTLDQDFVLVVANATAFTPSNYPPSLNAVGNKSIATNQLLQFTVSASDPVDGDSVRLWADGVPAWATFVGATNAASASSSFSGTAPAATGTYAVTFYAADKDGTNSESITITVNDCVPTNIVDEGFVGGATAPSGWTFTGIASTYTSAGNYGRASPSLKFDTTGDQIATPALNSPTNLQFWIKGQGTDSSSALLVEGYNGSAWSTVANVVPLPTTAATQSVVLAEGLTQIRFTYTKVTGNLSFDDVIIGGCGGGSAPASNRAPAIAVAGGISQSVVVNNELSFVVTVTDADADPVGVFTNAAPVGASFPEASGTAPIQSTFTWTPTQTGLYSTVFVAYDTQTAVTQTVAISVVEAIPELLAPVIQAASGILGTQFNANWLASSNATGYFLDVATNTSFSGGGGELTNISENIQSWTAHTSYSNWTQSITAGTVSMTDCIVSPGAAASGIGSIGRVQLKATTGILELPALDTVRTVTMNIAAGAIRTVKLQKYNGSTWDDLTTWSGIGTTGAAFTYDVNDSGSSVRLRIASPSGAIYVHDIIATSSGGGGATSYISGYENRDVGDVTACAVTGLTEGVTYYYRVKAYNATSNSPYSDTTNVTTAVAVNVPPVLGAIGNKSVTLGSNLQFQVSATPTDADPVTLTASNLPGDATFDSTNENGTFLWTNASPTGVTNVIFYATDKDGSDSEPITITVGEASSELLAPVIQPATLVHATQFNAEWLPSAGATGYRLDVATNSTFTSGGGSGESTNLIAFDFSSYGGAETRGTSIYAAANMQSPAYITRGPGLNASANGDRFNATGWSNHVDATAALVAGEYFEWTIQPVVGYTMSITNIVMNIQRSSTGASNLALRASHDGYIDDLLVKTGMSLANTTIVVSNELASVAELQNVSGAITFRMVGWRGASTGTMGFEGTGNDILIQGVISSGGGGTPSFVPGYENRDVGNVTTYGVTGLTESVTYYYRVKAYNATSNSPYSGTTSVVTTAASGTAPVLGAIGAKSVFLGEALQFQVSATPTESDPVTLTASDKPATATFASTNENGTFHWASPSPTGVYYLVFYATDTDGSDNEMVEITVNPLPQFGTFTVPAGSPASATVMSVAGQTYRMEYTTDLMAVPVMWFLADTEIGTGGEITLADPSPVDAQRYYRISVP